MDGLSAHQQSQLRAALALLESDDHAPTAVRTQDRAAQTHVADSLVALELELVRDALRIADLGSGAGFPGLALAVALPRAQVSLIESQSRRCEFLLRLSAAAEVENVSIICARAEEWRAGLSQQDLVVAEEGLSQSQLVALVVAGLWVAPGVSTPTSSSPGNTVP